MQKKYLKKFYKKIPKIDFKAFYFIEPYFLSLKYIKSFLGLS